MTNNTCVTCGYDNSRNHWDCLCHDILGNCECPTPTQSKASEPAEGEESKLRFDLQLIRNEKGNLEWIEDAPADHPDLVSDAREFYADKPFGYWNFDGSMYGAMAEFAQHKLQQAASPDAVIDEFVRRVKDRIGHQAEYGKDRWGEGVSEVVRAFESVAEEMKRK